MIGAGAKGPRVLLVEDSRMFSTAIRQRLEAELGVLVIHCATFSALRDELSKPENQFSIAILDLNQPDAQPGQALDFVLARGMKPIVFTATDRPGLRDRLMSRNAVDVVIKNRISAIDELVVSVAHHLELSKPRVLVVDNDETSLKTICDIVAQGIFRACSAPSIEQALTSLDEMRDTELVLLRSDMETGDTGGFLDLVTQRHGEGNVRVIGYAKPGDSTGAAEFLGAGGDDFIIWLGSEGELASRIHHVLDLHGQIRMLKRMASRDFLTDLFNRRYFFDRGPVLVENCLRQNKPVSAAIMDIDHFKKLNDNYGHEVGDLVLKTIARRLRAVVGEENHLLARLGGEEFGIIFANMDVKEACEFADMVREDISRARIVVEEEELSVTISMGLAEISASETFDNYLNAADQYLYMAKHSGRNKVFSDYHVAQSLTSQAKRA